MRADVFVDTNILVYAHDRDAGSRHDAARRLVEGYWRQDVWPYLSVQVLQELYVSLCRKNVPVEEARETVLDYSRWRIVENTVALLEAGIAEMSRWHVSFWDALVLAAARSQGAAVIVSEDLSDTQDYGGLRVVNPFA